MSIAKLSAGDKLPEVFNAIIEIPANNGRVKYEVHKKTGLLTVDRFMPTAMYYPCNYGFVPSTLAEDGDPLDILVFTPEPLQPASLIKVRPVGMLRMTDESGEDCKILSVPTKKVCVELANIKDIEDLPDSLLDRLVHFFEQYKALEPHKWVKVDGWESKAVAKKALLESVRRFRKPVD